MNAELANADHRPRSHLQQQRLPACGNNKTRYGPDMLYSILSKCIYAFCVHGGRESHNGYGRAAPNWRGEANVLGFMAVVFVVVIAVVLVICC